MQDTKWLTLLNKELNGWLDADLIDESHAQAIRQYYQGGREKTDRFMSALFTLGAVLVGLGLILYITSNLSFLGAEWKVTGIILLVLAFNATGYFLKFERQNYPGLGSALLLVGAFAFGGGIWLIAQIFQIPYNYADGILYWLLGLLPMAWLLRLKGVTLIAGLLLPIWFFVAVSQPEHSSWLHPLFLILWGGISLLVHRHHQAWAWFAQIISLCLWLGYFLNSTLPIIQSSPNDTTFLEMLAAYAVLGCILYSAGMTYRACRQNEYLSQWLHWPAFDGLLKFHGGYLLLFQVLPLTWAHHSWSFNTLFSSNPLLQGWTATGPAALWIYGGLLACMAILTVLRATTSSSPIRENLLVGGTLAAWLALLHLSPLIGRDLLSVFCNLLLIVQIISVLYIAFDMKNTWLFRLALFLFGLEILMRYVDTFWGILPRAVFFLIGGCLLILGGVLVERKRRKLEEEMKHSPEEMQ